METNKNQIKENRKNNIKNFCLNNVLVFSYAIFAVIYEVVCISFTDCFMFITRPIYALLILGVAVCIMLFFDSHIMKSLLSIAFLVIQCIFNIGFVYLYDSNGTFFEWAMMNQRNDAAGTIEDLSFRWEIFIILLVFLLIQTIMTIVLIVETKSRNRYKYRLKKTSKLYALATMLMSLVALVMIPVNTAFNERNVNYVDKYLYSSGVSKYQQRGITANAVYEFFNGTTVNSILTYELDGVEEFLYGNQDNYLPTSDYFGISKGNNLVYILVESFEWYAFLYNCTQEQSLELYPNLNKFLADSVYADSFYSREKTDTAEMLAIIGSNPSNKYINYDFPTNAYPWSLPNLFRDSVISNGNTVKQIKSFHQNRGSFYNREVLHENEGFDEFVSIEDMLDYGVVNTWTGEGAIGERTLDSQTMEKMKDEMFPITSDIEQYMTFWITFSMHGYYNERETFKEAGYYDKLDAVGAYPAGNGTKADYLRTYAAAVMDLDKAVGIMMKKLEANGQLDNTTIVMFGDHNTYYNNLSYYAKGISERYNSELYRVPFMIYDQKLKAEYEAKEETNVISKFTTTSDMMPTILDMFGIHGYKNLYFGTSMFIKDVESIIFSRAYGIFVTDKLICYSVKNLLYTAEGFTEEELADFEARAKIHLEKLQYLDKIYYNDYFKTHEYVKI